MKQQQNIKIKNFLKNLYEGNEYESSFNDEVYEWNGDFDEPKEVEYVFRYNINVESVYGESDKTITGMDVIINEFTVDGENMIPGWKEIGYNEDVWYIEKLSDIILDEMINVFPMSIYLTFYGKDEVRQRN
jgi:hypothetical protein